MASIVTHKWICDVCGHEHELAEVQTLHDPLNKVQAWYPVPLGWAWIDKKLICNKHTIEIDKNLQPVQFIEFL